MLSIPFEGHMTKRSFLEAFNEANNQQEFAQRLLSHAAKDAHLSQGHNIGYALHDFLEEQVKPSWRVLKRLADSEGKLSDELIDKLINNAEKPGLVDHLMYRLSWPIKVCVGIMKKVISSPWLEKKFNKALERISTEEMSKVIVELSVGIRHEKAKQDQLRETHIGRFLYPQFDIADGARPEQRRVAPEVVVAGGLPQGLLAAPHAPEDLGRRADGVQQNMLRPADEPRDVAPDVVVPDSRDGIIQRITTSIVNGDGRITKETIARESGELVTKLREQASAWTASCGRRRRKNVKVVGRF